MSIRWLNVQVYIQTEMNNQSRKNSIIPYPTAVPIKGKCKGIVAGSFHSYAYTDQNIYFWGQKHACQPVGTQSTVKSSQKKDCVESNEIMVVLELSVDKIATGKSHTFAWNDTNIYCWGNNQYYQLGLEEEKNYEVTKMGILEKAIQMGYQLNDISCGEHHTLAFLRSKNGKKGGSQIDQSQQSKNTLVYEQQQADDQNSNAQQQLFAWGQSNSYQLTINTLDIIPYPVLSPCTFKHLDKIYSRSDYNIALCSGRVYSWGCNLFSRLGQVIFSSQLPKVRIPREVILPQKITRIGIGTYHAVAVSESGNAYSWGKGNQGQLGVDKLQIEGRPSRVICEHKIIDASCGQSHTLVLLQDGRLMSCGSSSHGVLGHDSFDPNDKKKKVKRLQFVMKMEQIGQIVQISCGNNHNLVLNSKCEVFGWGSNEFYQIVPLYHQHQKYPKEKRSSQNSQEENTNKLKDQHKGSLAQRLNDWKHRYEAFKQARNKQQQLFMAELQQILQETGGRPPQ